MNHCKQQILKIHMVAISRYDNDTNTQWRLEHVFYVIDVHFVRGTDLLCDLPLRHPLECHRTIGDLLLLITESA